MDEKEYKLTISGIGIKKEVELTLDDLKTKFPLTTITATLQCAGNRRSEMNKVSSKNCWLQDSVIQFSDQRSSWVVLGKGCNGYCEVDRSEVS